jgi:hypothetical protein
MCDQNNDNYRIAVKCCDNCGNGNYRYGRAAICILTQKPLDPMCVCNNWKPTFSLEKISNREDGVKNE